MIEKEKHKLEVLKRRQERDIQQVGARGLWQNNYDHRGFLSLIRQV
jgi:hypothetical protein